MLDPRLCVIFFRRLMTFFSAKIDGFDRFGQRIDQKVLHRFAENFCLKWHLGITQKTSALTQMFRILTHLWIVVAFATRYPGFNGAFLDTDIIFNSDFEGSKCLI